MAIVATYRKMAVWGYQQTCALYLTLVVYSNLGLFLDYKFKTGNAPLFDAFILVLFIPLALGNFRQWIPFMKTGFFIFCCALAAIYGINYLRMTYGGIPYSELDVIEEVNRLQRVILWPVIGFMIYVIDTKLFRSGFLILLIVMPLITFMDFLNPTILQAPGEELSARAQGVYLNANIAAEAAVLLGLLNLNRFRGTIGIVLFFIVALGVLVTFSRSGIAALILLYAYLYVRDKLPKVSIIAPIVLALSFSTFIIYAEDILINLGYDSSVTNVIARLSFFEEVDTDNITADRSGESRAEIVGIIFSDALDKPITGHITDADAKYGMNPHNEPLFLWYTFGITGLIGWFIMVAVLWRSGRKGGIQLLNPAFFVFLWFSLFSHNILELRYWIVALAFFSLKPLKEWHGELSLLGHHINTVSSNMRRRKRRSRDQRKTVGTIVQTSGTSGRRKRRRTPVRF